MILLLLLVVVCLLVTLWMASRLVLAAHRRAGQGGLRNAACTEENAAGVSPPAPTHPVNPRPMLFAEDPIPTPVLRAFRQADDVFADPIDGVPFARGESTIPCRCGVAYRMESLDWLVGHFGGRCVQCGSSMDAALRYIL